MGHGACPLRGRAYFGGLCLCVCVFCFRKTLAPPPSFTGFVKCVLATLGDSTLLGLISDPPTLSPRGVASVQSLVSWKEILSFTASEPFPDASNDISWHFLILSSSLQICLFYEREP